MARVSNLILQFSLLVWSFRHYHLGSGDCCVLLCYHLQGCCKFSNEIIWNQSLIRLISSKGQRRSANFPIVYNPRLQVKCEGERRIHPVVEPAHGSLGVLRRFKLQRLWTVPFMARQQRIPNSTRSLLHALRSNVIETSRLKLPILAQRPQQLLHEGKFKSNFCRHENSSITF